MTRSEISIRSMEERDMERLWIWLNRDHMRHHYQPEPIPYEEVVSEYLPRLKQDHPTFCHIVLLDGQPFGYIQSYRITDYKEFAKDIGVFDGVAVDLFIGDEQFIGQGLGKQMLHAYVSDILPRLFPDQERCYIAHEKTNIPAIRCSLASGFVRLRDVIEGGKPTELLFQKL